MKQLSQKEQILKSLNKVVKNKVNSSKKENVKINSKGIVDIKEKNRKSQ